MSDEVNTPLSAVVAYKESPAALFDANLATLLTPNLTAEQMQAIMAVRRELIADRAREAFQFNYAAMTAQLPQIEKNGMIELIKGGENKGTIRYARWEDMDTIIRPIMVRHGFSLMFQEFISDGKPALRGKLMHIDGHYEIAERLIRQDPGPGRNAEQAWGSGTSYAKRYLGEGLLNIVRKGVDDDASTAEDPVNEDELNDLRRLLMDTMPQERTIAEYTTSFLSRMLTGIEHLEDVPRRDYARLKNALEDRKMTLQRRT